MVLNNQELHLHVELEDTSSDAVLVHQNGGIGTTRWRLGANKESSHVWKWRLVEEMTGSAYTRCVFDVGV